jgi:hypothetical protein
MAPLSGLFSLISTNWTIVDLDDSQTWFKKKKKSSQILRFKILLLV